MEVLVWKSEEFDRNPVIGPLVRRPGVSAVSRGWPGE